MSVEQIEKLRARKLRDGVKNALDNSGIESTIDENGNLMVAEKDLHYYNNCVKFMHSYLFE